MTTPHILVVDDDRRIRQLLQSYLAEQRLPGDGGGIGSGGARAHARRWSSI